MIPDPEKRAQAELAVQNAILTAKGKELDAAAQIITAEARGGWLQRNWRPMLMVTFMFIIANNYIFVPYAQALGAIIPVLDIPSGMWALLNVGVGGYVVGRSGEKIAKVWKESN